MSNVEERESETRTAFSRIPLHRPSDVADDRAHPLAKGKDYCFDAAKAHAERLQAHHRENHQEAEAELTRLQVLLAVFLSWAIVDVHSLAACRVMP